jgi:hypothetical protein
LDSDNHNCNSDLDAIIRGVKEEFKSILAKRQELVIKLGKAFENIGPKEFVCTEIKNALREEISQGLISRRNIERYCPDEWKNKTKPKKEENDNLSFSQQEQEAIPQLLVDANGNSVMEPVEIPVSDSNNNNVVNNEGSANEGDSYKEEYHACNAIEEVDLQQSLSKEDKIEKVEIEIKEIEIEPETKSNQIIHVQSQVEELKSEIKWPPNVDQEDKSFEAEFQLPYDTLCDHLKVFWTKHVKSISFIAKADFATKSITNIQIKRTDGEFEPIN